MKLLNTNASNAKILKSQTGTEYLIASLSLMPDDLICPARHIAECAKPCLEDTGRGVMISVKTSRSSKSAFWHQDNNKFIMQLMMEIARFRRYCLKQGKKPAFRLNTFSDIRWEQYGIPQAFPDCLFYDYTKISSRLGKTPDNYRLMFSYSAALKYKNQVTRALKTDVPIAAVFRGGMPASFLGRRVIDGDKSDLINMYSKNSIVGLKLKGGKRIQASTSPFIIDINQEMELAA